MARVAGRFTRVEPRRRARAFVLGLLSDLPRKNCWTIAEHAGDAGPAGMRHLLRKAVWDADAVRDDIRAVAVERLGVAEAILVVDETGDVKKGVHTVGVRRQYTGTAGRIENAQVGVFLTYTTTVGHTLIDRELYLPASWTDDPDRCAAAGVPEDTGFATKTELARRMLVRALDGGAAAAWVAGDEVYGAASALRTMLESRGVGYVLAVACDHRVTTAAGSHRVDAMVARLPKRAWQRLSGGAGAKGHRFHDWAWITVTAPDDAPPGHRWLLVRRNRRTGELAFYRCYSRSVVALSALVRVAGRRWTIEEAFQTSKGQTGLDEHQVRTWTSWHRWTTLVLLAHLFLAITTAAERAVPAPAGLIPLTLNEIRHLFIRLVIKHVDRPRDCLHWSWWRRRHQYRAQQAHYQRQVDQEP
ncbi:IS701 family transposase [Saccharothrix texasensis]|nr:IS701 family transposase [Saccharothrix texasensis]